MNISICIDKENLEQRKAELIIPSNELAKVHLKVDFPEQNIGKRGYLRRHPCGAGERINPNCPQVDAPAISRKPMEAHIADMRKTELIPSISGLQTRAGDTFREVPAVFAVSISDIVANLLRPFWERLSGNTSRLCYFQDEPIDDSSYWCLCCFERVGANSCLEYRHVAFDKSAASVRDASSGTDLKSNGLLWAVTLVPLIVHGRALDEVEIAKRDYDLRQIVGRDEEAALGYAYQGWFEQWNDRVTEVVKRHRDGGKRFASFYHNIIGQDAAGNLRVRQQEGTLGELARTLAHEGFENAGLLDSGGSCAIYDVWLGGYLNHGWYFREHRGGILAFELKLSQRIPRSIDGMWISGYEKECT